MLIASLAAAPEPAGKARVQLRPLCLRQAAVRDLARERVLDRILTLARQRRAGAPPDEVSLGEQLEVGHPADELIDRAGPEDAPDYRRCLQRRLHRVRNLEARGQLCARPGTVAAHEHAAVDQRRQQLLDEEWVALSPLD